MGALLLSAVLTGVFSVTDRAVRPLRRAVRARVEPVLRVTGMAAAVSFARHIAFDLPRSTTAAGAGLLAGIATIRLYLLASHVVPPYLAAYFVLVAVFALLAVPAMAAGRPVLAQVGWALGGVVALASLLMYIASRAWGLPGLPQLTGRWDNPLGTFSMILAAGYLALHASVVAGMNVAYPRHQPWHD